MSDAPNLDILTQLLGAQLPETVEDMRGMLDTLAGLLNTGLPEVGSFHEAVPVREVEGTAVTADVVVPKGAGPHPVLVYLHGGGWICGSPASHRKLAHRFAEAGYLVFNVDYRLAPEAPFPKPLEDCVDAIRWAAREAAKYGGDASKLAVGGDSAGGNLSAAAAIALADEPDAPRVGAALLIYGVFDFATLGEMPTSMADIFGPAGQAGPMVEAGPKLIELMVGSYIGSEPSEQTLKDPRLSPIHAASKLPPSHIVVGTADPLLGQARALVGELEQSGVEHEYVEVEGMPHGYAQMEFFPPARESIDRMVSFLRKHLGA